MTSIALSVYTYITYTYIEKQTSNKMKRENCYYEIIKKMRDLFLHHFIIGAFIFGICIYLNRYSKKR